MPARTPAGESGPVWYQKKDPLDIDSRRPASVWHCFVAAEIPFWKRAFHPFRRPNTGAAVSRLQSDLRSILTESPDIKIVSET